VITSHFPLGIDTATPVPKNFHSSNSLRYGVFDSTWMGEIHVSPTVQNPVVLNHVLTVHTVIEELVCRQGRTEGRGPLWHVVDNSWLRL